MWDKSGRNKKPGRNLKKHETRHRLQCIRFSRPGQQSMSTSYRKGCSALRYLLFRRYPSGNLRYIPEAEGQFLLKQLDVIGIRVDPQPCHICLPDPDDEIYLSVAIYAKADAVITGNIKHFPHKKCRNIRILTPRNFLNEDAFAS